MIGLYEAKRLDNNEVVVGNLIYDEDSPFCYILTKENRNALIFDEHSGRSVCTLIRVIKHTIRPI